jgi:hypothetical protein
VRSRVEFSKFVGTSFGASYQIDGIDQFVEKPGA